MKLYTFVFNSYYLIRIIQIASRLDEDTVKRTYLNSFFHCVSSYELKENQNIPENVYLYDQEIGAEDMSASI